MFIACQAFIIAGGCLAVAVTIAELRSQRITILQAIRGDY